MDDSNHLLVALPACVAVLAFLVWLCRHVRKSRRSRRQPSTLPSLHVVVVYDKNSAATEAQNAYAEMNDGATSSPRPPALASSSDTTHHPPTRQVSGELVSNAEPRADPSVGSFFERWKELLVIQRSIPTASTSQPRNAGDGPASTAPTSTSTSPAGRKAERLPAKAPAPELRLPFAKPPPRYQAPTSLLLGVAYHDATRSTKTSWLSHRHACGVSCCLKSRETRDHQARLVTFNLRYREPSRLKPSGSNRREANMEVVLVVQFPHELLEMVRHGWTKIEFLAHITSATWMKAM